MRCDKSSQAPAAASGSAKQRNAHQCAQPRTLTYAASNCVRTANVEPVARCPDVARTSPKTRPGRGAGAVWRRAKRSLSAVTPPNTHTHPQKHGQPKYTRLVWKDLVSLWPNGHAQRMQTSLLPWDSLTLLTAAFTAAGAAAACTHRSCALAGRTCRVRQPVVDGHACGHLNSCSCRLRRCRIWGGATGLSAYCSGCQMTATH